MGHVFDTGLAKPQRTLIREGIAARLADLLLTAEPPMYLRSIKFLPRKLRGQGDDEGKGMLLKAFQGQAPAIAIVLGRKPYDRTGPQATEHTGELEVVVYVASMHERDPDLVDGRLAQDVSADLVLTADPGIDTMLEHVEERLLGQELGIETVSALQGNDEDESLTYAELSVWAQTYTVNVDRTINPARGITQLVTEVENRVGIDGVSGDLDDPDPDAFVTTRSTLDPET